MSLGFARRVTSALAVVATLTLLAIASSPTDVQAAFSCQSGTSCPNAASCDGTNYTRDGCKIQCYHPKPEGTTGELEAAGSANCSPSGGGGGGGGGGDDWWCGTYCW